MSSQIATATSAVSDSCALGGNLTTITSTSTIIRTLPRVTNTLHSLITATLQDGLFESYTTLFVQTIEIISTPTTTGYSPVTYTTCIPTTTSSSETTPEATPTTSAETIGPSDPDNKKIVIICATVAGVAGSLTIALVFWLWWRHRRKRQLAALDASTRSMELIGFPYNAEEITHPKRSLDVTENSHDTNFTGTTLRDYVGSLPSISQRHLAKPDMDVQSVTDTTWSYIQRGGAGLPLNHSHHNDNRDLRSEGISKSATQRHNPYNDSHNPFRFSDVSSAAPPVGDLTASYNSRGSSAFIPVSNMYDNFRNQPPERVFSPSIYSQDVLLQRSTQNPERIVSMSVYSQPDPSEHPERTPSRMAAWAETLRRLESLDEDYKVDFTVDPTADRELPLPGHGRQEARRRSPVRSEDRDFETVTFDSSEEAVARRARGYGSDDTSDSVFSVNAVLKKIANEPPRTRDRR